MKKNYGLCYICKYSIKEEQPSSITYCKKFGKLMPNQEKCRYFKEDKIAKQINDYEMAINELFKDINENINEEKRLLRKIEEKKVEANMTDDEIIRMKLVRKKPIETIFPISCCIYNKEGTLISKNFYNSDGVLVKGDEKK